MQDGVIIIGGGECGVRAASALREHGFDGSITLIGDEHHAPYERPPLSKDAMVANIWPGPKIIRSPEFLAGAGVTLLTGRRVVDIRRESKLVLLDGGGTIPYGKLLLATGAVARRLPSSKAGDRLVRYLRTYDDATTIHRELVPGRRILIIGGGFIGLELAASARVRGAAVTVVEALPRVLTRVVPDEVATVVGGRHRREGVSIHCGVGVAEINESDTEVTITLQDGRHLSADVLLVGIGAVPNVELAEQAGLDVANGIVVDEYLRTSDPDIYAGGDCCSFPLAIYDGRRVRLESWRNAQVQGDLAARNMLGAVEPITAVPWFWSDQYDLRLQIAGLPDAGKHTVRRSIADDAFILFHLDEDQRLVAASGIGVGNIVARDIRIAEMLIAQRAHPDPAHLGSPTVKLKALLAA